MAIGSFSLFWQLHVIPEILFRFPEALRHSALQSGHKWLPQTSWTAGNIPERHTAFLPHKILNPFNVINYPTSSLICCFHKWNNGFDTRCR
jgi:hypothetical protein